MPLCCVYCYHPHYTDEETEVQSGDLPNQVTGPLVELGHDQEVWLQSPCPQPLCCAILEYK